MPRQKRPPSRGRTDADDPVLRALRDVADEALEETVPDRLLEVLRAARRGARAGTDGHEAPAGPAPPPDDAS